MESEQQMVEAVKAGDLARVKELVTNHPQLLSLKVQGWMAAALLALYYNEPEIARWLVSQGAPLDVFAAAATGSLPRLRDLLEEQPDLIRAYAPDGFQPLGLAAFFGAQEAAEYLLKKGAPVNSPSDNSMKVMPLHSAAATRQLEICRLLIEHGADVNAVQADDFTPLHAAAQNGHIELIELLLAHGAQPNVRTSDGRTPLSIAEASGQAPAAEFLRTHGASAS